MKRLGVFAALLAIGLYGAGPASAGTAHPNTPAATITVTETVDNSLGGGTATPDTFTYHVFDTTSLAEVANGTFDAGDGTTSMTDIPVPPGT